MILVTVGTQKFQFDRLLKKMDELIRDGVIKDKVIAQTGYSLYSPKWYPHVDFMQEDSFEKLLGECDILVTHGGIGTILKGLSMRKKIVIVPRMKAYGEHIDNHQFEIGDKFSKMGYTFTCEKIDLLGDYLCRIQECEFREFHFSYRNTADYIQKYLLAIEEEGAL